MLRQLIKELDEIVKDHEELNKDAVELAKEIREELDLKEPPILDELLLRDPPPLAGDPDPRVERVYRLLWDHREDVLARLYEPQRIYIGRALHQLVLEMPPARIDTGVLIEAAKGRFFQQIHAKWNRVRIVAIPTGDGESQTVVRSGDVLMTGILREMRQQGLLDEIEA